MSPRWRLASFAVVAFGALVGLANVAFWAVESIGAWAIDLQLVLDAGARLLAGEPIYADPKFLYPPLAAVLAAPLSRLDPLPVSLVYAGLKLVVVVAGAAWVTRGREPLIRALALVGLLTCLPFLHDLRLGNANTWLVAAIAWAAFGRDRPASGIALGLVAAVFAKPLLVPVLLWLLVARRRVLVGTVVAGLAATAAGALLAGPGAYVDWVEALVGGQRFAADFEGNVGVSALAPGLWLPVAAVTAALFLVVLVRRDRRVSLVWAVTCGILVAPYAGTYSALPIAVALPVLAPAMPAFTLLIVGLSPLAVGAPLPLFAAAILAGSLAMRPGPEPAGWSLRTP